MSRSSNVEVVQRLYEALERSDRAAYPELTHANIQWEFMDEFPHGGVRVGWDEILEQTFVPLMEEFSEWHIEVEDILDAGEAVVGMGRYRGQARQTGKEFTARFAHVFRLHEGKIARVTQFADTAQLQRALGR